MPKYFLTHRESEKVKRRIQGNVAVLDDTPTAHERRMLLDQIQIGVASDGSVYALPPPGWEWTLNVSTGNKTGLRRLAVNEVISRDEA